MWRGLCDSLHAATSEARSRLCGRNRSAGFEAITSVVHRDASGLNEGPSSTILRTPTLRHSHPCLSARPIAPCGFIPAQALWLQLHLSCSSPGCVATWPAVARLARGLWHAAPASRRRTVSSQISNNHQSEVFRCLAVAHSMAFSETSSKIIPRPLSVFVVNYVRSFSVLSVHANSGTRH